MSLKYYPDYEAQEICTLGTQIEAGHHLEKTMQPDLTVSMITLEHLIPAELLPRQMCLQTPLYQIVSRTVGRWHNNSWSNEYAIN